MYVWSRGQNQVRVMVILRERLRQSHEQVRDSDAQSASLALG